MNIQSIIDTVAVVANDSNTYAVVGGTFSEMLAFVKGIEGRRWNAANKSWEIAISPADLASLADEEGFRLVSSSNLLEEEMRQVGAAQQRVLAAKATIEAKIASLNKEIGKYSRGSVSSVKRSLSLESFRLSRALEYASVPAEQLTEQQMRALLAVEF
jgi:hypothetical protein